MHGVTTKIKKKKKYIYIYIQNYPVRSFNEAKAGINYDDAEESAASIFAISELSCVNCSSVESLDPESKTFFDVSI